MYCVCWGGVCICGYIYIYVHVNIYIYVCMYGSNTSMILQIHSIHICDVLHIYICIIILLTKY